MRKKLLKSVILSCFVAQSAFAGVYDFKKLHHDLGYDNTTDDFGSSTQELQDLDSYTDKYDDFFTEINGYLRFYPAPYDWTGTGPEQAKVMVKNIDAIFKRVPEIPSDITLFHGVTLEWHQGKPFEIGEEYTDQAYISTTTTRSVAQRFANGLDNEKPEKGAVFTLYFNQPHAKGILIDQGEDEVMLMHGEHFRIMKRDLGEKSDAYLVQICGSIPCATQVPAGY